MLVKERQELKPPRKSFQVAYAALRQFGDLGVSPESAGDAVRPAHLVRHAAGLKAPDVTAWAEASPTSGGPDQPSPTSLKP